MTDTEGNPFRFDDPVYVLCEGPADVRQSPERPWGSAQRSRQPAVPFIEFARWKERTAPVLAGPGPDLAC